VTREVEEYLKTLDDIEYYVANIGHGNPQLYYNLFPERNNASHAQIYIKLKEFNRKRMEKLITILRQKFKLFPGAKINVKELEQGHVVEAPVAIRVLGKNMDILKEISQDIEKIIASQEGAVNVKNPLDVSRTDLYVHVDKVRAKLAGLSLSEIDKTIRAAVNGMTVSSYRDAEGKEYDIIVRLPFKEKISNKDLDKIYISNLKGNAIPLNQVAQVEFSESEERIDHFQLERSVTLTADVMRNQSVNKITESIITKLKEYNWPNGYRYSVAGELESRTEAFGGMQKAIIIAALVIFGVLVLQFRSYIQPFIIFTSIPLAIIGSLWALFITGNTFSFTAFVGFTSLVGIVVNNAIILIDYTNRLRQQGKNIETALINAGKTRFVPIILTTLTTIGGLLPLTLIGGPIWAPMGWTIIGGLLCSTFLTLIIVPVMYKIVIRK
ncbi:MAG: efflux RND transporter permease subunit, partial [bacterium]